MQEAGQYRQVTLQKIYVLFCPTIHSNLYTPCKISRGINNQGKSDPRPSRLTTKDSGYLHRCAACDSQSVLPTLTFGGNCSSQKRRRRRNKKERHFLEVLHVFAHATRKIYMTRAAAGKKEWRERGAGESSRLHSQLCQIREKRPFRRAWGQ